MPIGAASPSFHKIGRNRKGLSGGPIVRSDLLYIVYDLLVVWDAATVGLAGYVCAILYTWMQGPDGANLSGEGERIALVGSLLAPFLLRDKRVLAALTAWSLNDVVARTAQRMAVFMALVLAVGFLTRAMGSVPRLWVLSWFLTAFAAALLGRLIVFYAFRAMTQRGMVCDRVAVIGSGPGAQRLLRHVRTASGGVRLVATFGDTGSEAELDEVIARVIELGRSGEVDRVVIGLHAAQESRVFEIAHRLKAVDVEVTHCLALLDQAAAPLRTTTIAGAPVMVLTNRPHSRWGLVLKRVGDRVIALAAIIVVAPVLGAIAVAVRLESPGPVVFRQRRHGCNNTEFEVFKFRTMHHQKAPAAGSGEVQTRRGDKRVTRVGKLLRETSLDELPQLFNVLNGTMSLVGPRPHPVVMKTEERLGEEIIAEYAHRHRVKPGITGWAQINGHRGATDTADQVRRRVEYDIYYIENWSLLFDLKILLMTPISLVFQRSNAF